MSHTGGEKFIFIFCRRCIFSLHTWMISCQFYGMLYKNSDKVGSNNTIGERKQRSIYSYQKSNDLQLQKKYNKLKKSEQISICI